MARSCHPALSQKDADAAVTAAERYARFTNQKIADWLGITREESSHLETWKCATFYQSASQNEAMPIVPASQFRLTAMLQIIEELDQTPTARQMSRLLKERGLSVSHVTISKDYKRLKINDSNDAWLALFSC